MPGLYPPSGERIPDEMIDRFFDRQLDAGEKAALFAQLRAQPDRACEVVQTQQILAELDDPIIGPDLVGGVLDRVHQRRAFLPSRWRSVVTVGRALVAVCVLATIGGVALLERYAPALTMDDRPMPVTRMVTSGPQTVLQDVGTIVRAGRSLFDERSRVRRTAPGNGVIAAARASEAGGHEMVVVGRPGRTWGSGVGRFEDDRGARAWTVDASAMAPDLGGSGSWVPASSAVFVPSHGATGAGVMHYNGATSMGMNLDAAGHAVAFSAWSVDIDPFTMRLRSIPDLSIETTLVRFTTTIDRDAQDDVGIGGLRLVRLGRVARDRAPRR